jgi:hypothetical protein
LFYFAGNFAVFSVFFVSLRCYNLIVMNKKSSSKSLDYNKILSEYLNKVAELKILHSQIRDMEASVPRVTDNQTGDYIMETTRFT